MKAKNNIYYTILYYTILYYTILYYTILYYTILYYTILYYTILYYTILYYTILYYTILYYTILYYTILYYTILYKPKKSKSYLNDDQKGSEPHRGRAPSVGGPWLPGLRIWANLYLYLPIHTIHICVCIHTKLCLTDYQSHVGA